jgi:diguanylate cyclase (GGDEF)-like protein
MDVCSHRLDTLDQVLDRIDNHKDVDVVLISEEIIDIISYNIIDREIVKSRNIPYLIINTSEKILMEAIHSNAQDVILMNNLDIDRAIWSILHSFERNKMINRLYEDSIEDALTGLYNRRGFLSLAEDAISLMKDLDYYILFIDLDKMKQINDDYGHNMGDSALQETSKILKSSFREGDIISRYGGDEFIVFVSDVENEVIDKIKRRIDRNVKLLNESKKFHYTLALTVGHSKYNSSKKESLEQVIERADENMYSKKGSKKK